MKETKSFVTDEETRNIIERLGKEVVLTDNVSQIIRYALKYTAKELLEDK